MAKTPFLIAALLVLPAAGTRAADIGTPPVLDKQTVLSLLPPWGRKVDNATVERGRRLVAYGEASHPFLAEIAAETDDFPDVLGPVMGILSATGRGKPLARSIVRDILQRFLEKQGEDAGWAKHNAILTLDYIGTEEDIPVLLPLLERNDNDVQGPAAYALGNMGDETTATQIKAAMKRVMAARPSTGTIGKGQMIQNMNDAIKSIGRRLEKQHAPKSTPAGN